jgi:hypothetical protein
LGLGSSGSSGRIDMNVCYNFAIVTLIFGFDKEIWRLGKVESWCDDPKK